MNQQKPTLDRLLEMVKPDLPTIEKNAIVKDDDGSWLVFGRYRIDRYKSHYTVKRYLNTIGIFSNLRSALSWCVADKFGQYKLANDILHLEKQYHLLRDDLRVRSNLAAQIRQNDRYESVQIKLEQKKIRLRTIETRLDKCINLAKYWQLRGFNNETARTGRSASQRTSR